MQDKIVELLRALIAFPSVSNRSNLDIADFIVRYLGDEGVGVTRIPSADGRKTSLLATIGSQDQPGIMLSGHMDVVPTEGQNWTTDPFTADIRNGRVYGRGATDMKGFLAVILAHVPEFRQRTSNMPIHLAFSYDEEVGCRGVPDLAAAASRLPSPPVLCIVGEPTSMKVARAHKGKIARRLTFTGLGGHSAFPDHTANAVLSAARVATAIAAIAERLNANGLKDPAFQPPHSTLHVGSIHGGGALNLVPDRATLECELRYLPGESVQAILDEIGAAIAIEHAWLTGKTAEGVAVEELSAYPDLNLPADFPAIQAIARLAGDNAPGSTVSFGTEAGVFQANAIPSLVCGPGDISRAHKADEWIGLDELTTASSFMDELAAIETMEELVQ